MCTSAVTSVLCIVAHLEHDMKRKADSHSKYNCSVYLSTRFDQLFSFLSEFTSTTLVVLTHTRTHSHTHTHTHSNSHRRGGVDQALEIETGCC